MTKLDRRESSPLLSPALLATPCDVSGRVKTGELRDARAGVCVAGADLTTASLFQVHVGNELQKHDVSGLR